MYMCVDLVLGERVKLTISRGDEKYEVIIKNAKSDKIISFLDTFEPPWKSAFVRARIRNEILKFIDYGTKGALDRDIMGAILENLDKLREL